VCEAEEMVASGVRELNLVAQDTTRYGSDAPGQAGLEALLRNLAAIKDLAWIRLLYCHPESISDGLLTVLEQEEKVCPYLDIPFQHVHPEILRAMKRPIGKETPMELVQRIRSVGRTVYLRTTMLVGFPGETDEMFETLCSFVEEVRFHHLGVFAFSPEQGTAAHRLEPRVDPSVAEMRRGILLERQRAVSTRLNQESLGQVIPVLVEGESEETPLLLSGRTPWMAPDVDGRVLINKGTGIAGEIMPVRITEAHAYDLVGEVAG
jgi:ribosomal protein S12 methylthiotransferase